MEKRLFQVLDEMNHLDGLNNTRNVEVCSNFISVDKVKGGAKIAMGIPEQSMYEIMNNKKMAVLLLIDKDEWNKYK